MSQFILMNHISCKCKCKFDGRICNSNRKWNNDKCQCECKNSKERNACEKDYVWNFVTCTFENGVYLASYIDNSVIASDEIVNASDSVSTNGLANIMSAVSTKALSHSFFFLTIIRKSKLIFIILYLWETPSLGAML